MSDNSVNLLPGKYTAKGSTLLVFDSYNDDDYTTSYTIYNENLIEIASFTTPVPPTYELTSWRQEKQQGPIGISIAGFNSESSPVEIDGETFGLTTGQILEFVKNNWSQDTKITMLFGQTVIVVPNGYYYQEIYGDRYPLEIIRMIDDQWFHCWVDYQYEDWGPTNIWGERYEDTDTRTPSYPVSLTLLSEYNDDTDIDVTQTLFNSDDKFEYCIPVVRVADFSEEDVHYRRGGQRLEYTGFDVYSNDGTIVRQFRFPEGYYAEYLDLNAMTLNNINYIVAEEVRKGDEYFSLVYRADGTSSASAPALIQRSASVSPTAPQRGQTVHVDLGVEAKPGCSVSVVNAQGREVNRINVAEGNNAAEIRTDSFDRGVYVVVVKNGNKKQEVTKIVVR